MQITIYDFLILAIIGLGVWEGRKKGFYQMIIPFISFIISIFLMKWVSMFIMNIWGDSLIMLFSEYLNRLIEQMQLSDLDMIQEIKEDFIQKIVQGGVFIISYAAINVVVTVLLNKLKKISNNMVIYRIDQILGCVFGALSNVFTVMLVLTVAQILCDMNIEEIIYFVEDMKQSEIIRWLLDNNYIYKLFLTL